MSIKKPFWFWSSVALAVVVVYFVLDRTVFLVRAERTTGVVTEVHGVNTRCGRKRKHNCTRFTARVRFTAQIQEYTFSVSAGSARGHRQPLSRADYDVGESVPVVYNPGRPEQAYRDAFWDVWGTPVLAFFFQIAALLGSFQEKKKSVLAFR
jgi:hypothetical protein